MTIKNISLEKLMAVYQFHFLMFKYLVASLVSKDSKTNIGDNFINKNDSRLAAYLHFFVYFPFESWVFIIKKVVMAKVVEFEQIHSNVGGIDIGSREIYVSIGEGEVVKFGTFTVDYHACCKYLKEKRIESVAMEATGVYWMSLYSILEDYGIEVCLVHPREVQQVKGRKTDVKDCQWIQKLYSAGLLRESIVCKGQLKELRILIRERLDLIEMGSTYVNKMQKYLDLMNIKLRNVISQIHGASGLRMIKAILSGERDSEKLLSLCHERIITNKKEDVIKSLEGEYNDTYLRLLGENLHLWEEHQTSVQKIEEQIAQLLDDLNQDNKDMEVTSRSKPARHHQPKIEKLHTTMP
jgi:hypothetical protein